MLHAGVLKKFGLYGLIRDRPAVAAARRQTWTPIIGWLCLGNLFYCGWVAMRQKNFNWLIGYSSVAHMGFVFLGIASLNLIGVTGAVLVMIAHGFLAALTFGLNGYIYQQTGTLEMEELGGVAAQTAVYRPVLLDGGVCRVRIAGVCEFCRRSHRLLRCLESIASRDRDRVLGRVDCRRDLHAARGSTGSARPHAGTLERQ